MIDQKQVELLIQARLKGGRDLESITKSIAELEKALESQADAARRGEKSFDGLKAAQEALKQVQEELGARGKALQDLESLTRTIDRQATTVEKAKTKLDEYQKSLKDDRTSAQQERVQKLSLAYQTAQQKLEGYRQSFDVLQTALKQSGVDTSNLAEAQRQVQDGIVGVASAINRAGNEIRDYNDNLSKAKETLRQARSESDLFAAAEKRAADATAARNKRYEEYDALVGNRRAKTAADIRQFEEEAAAQKRAAELAALRADIERRSAEAADAQAKRAADTKRDDGLRKTADDAEKAARGYSTLARASTNLRPKIVSIADAIKQITQPAQESLRTLAGVEGQIKEVATAVGGIKGPVADAAAQFQRLRDAQRAIEQQAGLIDNFRKQAQALRETEQALFKAESEFAKYAAEVRKGGDSAQKFVSELAKAKGQVESASNALRRQRTITEEAARSLAEIGIDSRNLGEAQDRLARGARTATEATKTLTEAVKQYGNETARAEGKAKGFSLFRDEGRTTLSLAQRIRGEVLALTASYVGLQGAVGLAADSLRVLNQQQGLRNTLAFAFGTDAAGPEVANEIEYLIAQADRLGISFEAASKSYAKFSAAARKSGATLNESRFIFEAFSEVGRVINLTPDEINGLFNAIGQSFSKGKIQAEELRQQIGERLPGAFAFAQEALKDTFPDLDKALEQGQVGAENLLTIAESIRKSAQSALGPALQNLDAEQQRFNNSVLFFKKEIAKSGFADSYVALLKDLREFFQSDDGKEFARGISDALSLILDSFRSLLSFAREYSSELKAIATALLWFGAIKATQTLTGRFIDLVAAIRAGGVALTALQRAFIVIQLAVAAFQIAKYFFDEFKAVREIVASGVSAILKGLTFIGAGAKTIWAEFPRWAENAFKSVINSGTLFMRTLLAIFAAGARALGLGGLADGINKVIDKLTLKTNNAVSSRVAEIQDELEAALKSIERTTKRIVGEDAPTPAAVAAQVVGTTASPGKRSGTTKGKTQAELDAEQRKVEAITKALETLESKIDRAQTDTLSKQLEAIDTEYQALARKIQALGGEQSKVFLQRLEEGVAQLKLQTTRKFNDKLEAEQQALLSKVEQAEASSGRKQKNDLDARLKAIRDSYEARYREIAELRVKLEQNGRDTGIADEMKRRLDLAVQELTVLERQKFIKDELESRERQVNDLLRARRDTIELIRQQEEAGLITSEEADKRVKDAIANLQPQIDALVTLGYDFAASIQGAFDPAAIEKFVARLQLAKQSGKNLNDELDKTRKFGADDITKIVDSGLDGFIKAIEEAAAGTAKWGDIFQATGRAILGTVAEILKEIAKVIIKQQILKALRYIGVPVAHSGMVVGQGSNRSRNVAPGLFSLAPRYHTGGIVGLRPDEYPAILQKNEEVLSTSDPRNVLNGGMSAGKQTAPSQRFVLVDDRSRVAEAMAGTEGEEVTIMHLRKNIPTLRALLKG